MCHEGEWCAVILKSNTAVQSVIMTKLRIQILVTVHPHMTGTLKVSVGVPHSYDLKSQLVNKLVFLYTFFYIQGILFYTLFSFTE